MKKILRQIGIIALTAVIGFSFVACGSGNEDDIEVIFSNITANGSGTQTTTQLTLTFSQAITDLSAADITLTGVSNVTKGTLNNSGTTYTLPISGFTSGGTLNVTVSKTGYNISGSPKIVTIYYYSGSIIDSGGGLGPNNEVPGDTLSKQAVWLFMNAQSNKAYTLTAKSDETFGCNFQFSGKSNITVTLIGSGGEKIITTNLLTVGDGVTLILDRNITLKEQYYNQNDSSLWIYKNGALVMNEGAKIISGGASIGVYTAYEGATFTMNGGEISGFGSAVNIESKFNYTSNSTFTMNGGTISGNNFNDTWGSVIFICGKNAIFNMNGGTISGNTNTSGCGGVEVYGGTFTMNGGEISGNTSKLGGGVHVSDGQNSGGTFTMNGGEISGNTATLGGGGVCVWGVQYNKVIFTMNGGEIYGNTASYGGGVCVYNEGIFRINNGIVYGSNAGNGKANNAPPNNSSSGLTFYNGSSLYIQDKGIAQYGNSLSKIPVEDNSPYNYYYRETTINVVNGVLQ